MMQALYLCLNHPSSVSDLMAAVIAVGTCIALVCVIARGES